MPSTRFTTIITITSSIVTIISFVLSIVQVRPISPEIANVIPGESGSIYCPGWTLKSDIMSGMLLFIFTIIIIGYLHTYLIIWFEKLKDIVLRVSLTVFSFLALAHVITYLLFYFVMGNVSIDDIGFDNLFYSGMSVAILLHLMFLIFNKSIFQFDLRLGALRIRRTILLLFLIAFSYYAISFLSPLFRITEKNWVLYC